MLLFSPRWLFFIPGCVLFALGLLMTAILLPGPLPIGGVNFDTNTLLVSAMAILVGFKLIMFWVFAKVFAVSSGLLPPDPRSERISRLLKLEAGLAAGAALIVTGLGFLIWGVFVWKGHEFGSLSYPESLRIVIPGITGIILGVEVIFSSFFLSVLRLPRR
jgi:hypothetical protein